MATAVASSHNSHYRPAVCSSSSSPVVSPLSSTRRVRVNPSPACVARPAESAADKDDAADRRGRHCHRLAHDERPRRTTTSPGPPVMRRRRRDAYASPVDRKRRRGSSDARADYHRRPDDAHRRGRDDDAAHRVSDTSKDGEERDRAREDDTRRRRSSSRSSKERRAPRAYHSPGAAHHHHHPAAESRDLGVDEDRKRSTEKEVDQAEDAEARRRRDELQRKREEARGELDKVVRTVWFNDPYISPTCVLNTMPRWSWSEVEEGEVV